MLRARVTLSLNMQEITRMVRVGFPILAAGLLYGLLTTVDRWLVTFFIGITELGYYSLAIMALLSGMLLPGVIGQQIYPRIAEEYGRSGRYSNLKKWILKQAGWGIFVAVLAMIAIYIAMPLLVERFLPAYIPGISAMRIIVLGLPFLALAGAFANFLNTVDKQKYYMAMQAVAVVINLVLSTVFVKMGMGIEGVALGTALTYAIYGLIMACISMSIIKSQKQPVMGDLS
jgi:O-antigen/teichoic acid export membrane protein